MIAILAGLSPRPGRTVESRFRGSLTASHRVEHALMPDPVTSPAASEPTLDIKSLLKVMVVIVVLVMVVIGGVLYLFRDPLRDFAKTFVENFEGVGVAVGFFIPDAFTIPLPNDAFTVLGLLGGMPFWTVVMWGTIGSITGGSVGWLIGRRLSKTRWFKRIMEKRGAEMTALVDKYGTAALLTAALTPLPYSLACWATGAGGMGYWKFLAISSARVVRVALYLYLIDAGVVAVLL
jgi:membrane protein YqaA with SNARE-associated domain